MRVISNTSPICNLAVIGQLHLLQKRYSKITVPVEVWLELSRLGHQEASAVIHRAYDEGWLEVQELAADRILRFQPQLDPGETAAISLAYELKADLLLIDELKGRNAARNYELKVAGLLGELVYAKKHGTIASLKKEINNLKQLAGFFIKSDLERYLLHEVGEI